MATPYSPGTRTGVLMGLANNFLPERILQIVVVLGVINWRLGTRSLQKLVGI